MDLRLLRYFVVVVEERHIGRAAARLHITQPPLSRAIQQLESDLGATLLDRTPRGVTPTAAGAALAEEARALFEQVDRIRTRVRAEAGNPTLTIGTLADTAELVSNRVVDAFRREHPHVDIAVHEADLSDPTAGLRADLVDVALTRTPFDETGLRTLDLSSEPVGLVVRADDPLAGQQAVSVAVLTGRRWIRLPEGTDPRWAAYWTGQPSQDAPVLRTIQECLQSVLWNGASALAPLGQPLPSGLAIVPVDDRAPSRLVVTWRDDRPAALVQSFVRIAARA
ncbi:LysR family transcriptional regulator [Winogradskya humida]|uniref:LysR family transcriptional regulator n=1 Tax=Winogradskya humida TaxID=113566 RepID=UPI00194519F9|nr:LysR substrate-binding domain-containing protein [Actinoplanes humidus]